MNGADAGTIGRADIVAVLADREWHTIAEIREWVYPNIAPEVAAKVFRHTRRNANCFSEQHVADKGKQAIVVRVLSPMLKDKLIESEGMIGDPQRTIRLIGWYCNGCGVRIKSAWDAKPPHGCCPECHLAITGAIV